MRKRRILDLCSGLGGASEAFIDSEQWEVVRVENNPALITVPNTEVGCVLDWLDWIDQLGPFDVIWASPPCLEFSNAYNAPKSKARRAGELFEPDMSIVEACKAIIDHVNPTWWVIENVAGASPHFAPLLGKHRQIIGPYFLWGEFPTLSMPEGWSAKKKTNDWNIGNPMRANIRALIPYELSNALLEQVDALWSLERFA